MKVDTAVAHAMTIPRTLKLRGSLEPNRHSDVASDTAGKVLATAAERGAFVKKGSVIARLDVSNAALNAQQAKADRASADADAALAGDELARTQKLVSSGSIGEAELVRAKARKATMDERASSLSAKAALTSKNVSDGLVRAPFDGVIAERWVDEGEYVGTSTKIVTLVDAATLRLKLFVPEVAASAIKQDQDVAFTVVGDADHVQTARVRYVGPELNAGSRELVVEAVVDNSAGKLVPGGFATAKVTLGTQNAIGVPADALRKQGAFSRVFVVNNGKLEDRVVDVNDSDATNAFIVDGLKDGDQVVVHPSADLRDGTLVSPTSVATK